VARPPDPEKQQQRRDAIEGAVYELLIERSWSAITLAEVGKRAEVSKALVVHYYGDKRSLLLASVRRFLDRQAEMALAIAGSDGPIAERLATLVTLALPDHEEIERQMRFQLEVWSFAKTDADALAVVRNAYKRFREACEAMIEIGKASGYITNDDPEWSYLLLHGLLDGLSFQTALDPSLDIDALRAKVIAHIDGTLTA